MLGVQRPGNGDVLSPLLPDGPTHRPVQEHHRHPGQGNYYSTKRTKCSSCKMYFFAASQNDYMSMHLKKPCHVEVSKPNI